MSTVFGAQPTPSTVVSLCAELIRLNTSNPTHTEAPAAHLVADVLSSCNLAPMIFEDAVGRTNVVARVPGENPSLPPLLVHTHLDVVPAVESDWTYDPFGGHIDGEFLWGRGSVDMKNMVAAVLAVIKRYHELGKKPRRDLVLAFFADEEAGGGLGARYMTTCHPELFMDCSNAIGEVGGFSHTITASQRLYLVSSAEKGVRWARLRASGRSGHGSAINDKNPVTLLCNAITRITDAQFATRSISTVDRFLAELKIAVGTPEASLEELLRTSESLSRIIRASTENTINPTILVGGFKSNVVPAYAEAVLDCRSIPGYEDELKEAILELAGPDIAFQTDFEAPGVESPWEGDILDAMQTSLTLHDPAAKMIPYMSAAFTDAKWLSKLGIRCYGFSPLKLPRNLDFTSLFHGIDERVPLSSLEFSVDVLGDFFGLC